MVHNIFRHDTFRLAVTAERLFEVIDLNGKLASESKTWVFWRIVDLLNMIWYIREPAKELTVFFDASFDVLSVLAKRKQNYKWLFWAKSKEGEEKFNNYWRVFKKVSTECECKCYFKVLFDLNSNSIKRTLEKLEYCF